MYLVLLHGGKNPGRSFAIVLIFHARQYLGVWFRFWFRVGDSTLAVLLVNNVDHHRVVVFGPVIGHHDSAGNHVDDEVAFLGPNDRAGRKSTHGPARPVRADDVDGPGWSVRALATGAVIGAEERALIRDMVASAV